MAEDVASLGFAIDSAPLVAGANALKSVAVSGDEAATSQKKYGTATQQAAEESRRAISANQDLQRVISGLSADVSRLTSAMNDNQRSAAAANDNVRKTTSGYSEMGDGAYKTGKSLAGMAVETLKIAGYLKLATAVAFNASPALRGVVDNATLKTVQTAGPAFAAMGSTAAKVGVPVAEIGAAAAKTSGILSLFFKVFSLVELAMFGSYLNGAGLGMKALAGATIAASPALRGALTHEVIDGAKALPVALGASAVAAKNVSGTFSGIIGSTLEFVSKMAIPVLAAAAAWESLKYSVTLANERIEKVTELLKKSNDTGVGVEYLQRIELSAKKTAGEVDSLIKTMTKFNEVTKAGIEFGIQKHEDKDKVGLTSGELDKRLKELTDLGNFSDNAFVKQYRDALTVEDKYRAIIALLQRAGEQGQRLAALNLASTFASPETMERLKANLGYLSEAQERADKISATKLLSPEDVAVAFALKRRLEEAENILHERWLPTQNVLVDLGIKLKEVWIGMVETLASGLSLMNHLVDGAGDLVSKAREYAAIPFRFGASLFGGGGATGESSSVAAKTDADMQKARTTLTGLLLQQKAVNAAMQDTVGVYDTVLGSEAKIVKAKEESTKSWDREIKSIEKHNATIRADMLAIGKSESEHAALRVESQLLRAAQEDELGVTEKQIERYEQLRATMSAADALKRSGITLSQERQEKLLKEADAVRRLTDALERAKILNEISFGQKTLFLTDTDVQIATKLKVLYGDDVPRALDSTYASAMRVNEAMHLFSTTVQGNVTSALADITMGTVSAKEGFKNLGVQVLRSLDEMLIKMLVVQPVARSLQSALGGFFSLSPGALSARPSPDVVGPFASGHDGAIIGQSSSGTRWVHPAYFDDAPRFHGGGMLGAGEVPFVGMKGEEVGWPNKLAQKYGGGGDVTINYQIDASGADPAAAQRIEAQLAQHKRELPGIILTTMRDAKRRSVR